MVVAEIATLIDDAPPGVHSLLTNTLLRLEADGGITDDVVRRVALLTSPIPRADTAKAFLDHCTVDQRPVLLAIVLAAVDAIPDPWQQLIRLSTLLARVTPVEQPPVLDRAHSAARMIHLRGGGVGVDQMRQLCASLPDMACRQLLADALQGARNERNSDSRATRLSALAPLLAERPHHELVALWEMTLPVLAAHTRRDLLADLHALVPVLHALGGNRALKVIAQSVIALS